MPLELQQSSPVPQPVDQAQPGLEQAQHGSPQVVYQAVLAGGDRVGPPQQQPNVDQRQGQQQPRQTVPVPQARQFQPEAPAVVLVVPEHLLDLEALAVAGASSLTGGLGGQQVPGLLASPVPVHRQVETTDGMLLGEGHSGPEAALPWTQGRQHLEPFRLCPAHILMGPQPQAEAPALTQSPLGQDPSAKLPVAQQDHLGAFRHPASYDTQDFPLLVEAGSSWPQHLPHQGQRPAPPADANVEDVEGVPLRAVQDQQQLPSPSHNLLQNPLGQGTLEDCHLDPRVLQEPLHPLLQGIPAGRQGGTGDHLPHLEAAAPENADGHCSQIHHSGFWFCWQVTQKLLDQVGKEQVLCFNHGCLRCWGVCVATMLAAFQPGGNLLIPYPYARCPLLRQATLN